MSEQGARRESDLPEGRPIPFIPQHAGNDCGPACLAMVLSYNGRVTELNEVVDSADIGQAGMDMWSLLEAARRFGLDGEGVRLEDAEALGLLPPGSILHWSARHYVVIENYQPGSGARIVDPAYGPREVTPRALLKNFSGIAIVLAPGPGFQPRSGVVRPVPRRQLIVLRAAYWADRLLSFRRSATGLTGAQKRSHLTSSTVGPSAPEP